MGNKFDMISANPSGSINNLNLLNETFHVFSKSPASDVTTLGGARLKSGHTTTTTDVWADEIPAFFNAANQAKFDLFSTLAVKDDLCIFGSKVYQHNGEQFVSLGAEAEILVDGATFQKNNKDVIKYHKNRTAINLTADNNNGDGSNNLTAKIYDAATGSTNFVSQFISSTDKMVAGVPSLAYDATVIAGGVKLAEGLTNDNDYICNSYAGVIQFNKARSQGSVTVSAWEYIGDTLSESIEFNENELKSHKEELTAKNKSIHVNDTDRDKWDTAAAKAGTAVQDVTSGNAYLKRGTDNDNITLTLNVDTNLTDGATTNSVPSSTAVTNYGSSIISTHEAKKDGNKNIHVTASERSSWDTAASTAATAVQTVKRTDDSSTLISVNQSGTTVSVGLSNTVATKTDVSTAKQEAINAAKVTLVSNTGSGITLNPNGTASNRFEISVDDTIATKDDINNLENKIIDKTVKVNGNTPNVSTSLYEIVDKADEWDIEVDGFTKNNTVSLIQDLAIPLLTEYPNAKNNLSGETDALSSSIYAQGIVIHSEVDMVLNEMDIYISPPTSGATGNIYLNLFEYTYNKNNIANCNGKYIGSSKPVYYNLDVIDGSNPGVQEKYRKTFEFDSLFLEKNKLYAVRWSVNSTKKRFRNANGAFEPAGQMAVTLYKHSYNNTITDAIGCLGPSGGIATYDSKLIPYYKLSGNIYNTSSLQLEINNKADKGLLENTIDEVTNLTKNLQQIESDLVKHASNGDTDCFHVTQAEKDIWNAGGTALQEIKEGNHIEVNSNTVGVNTTSLVADTTFTTKVNELIGEETTRATQREDEIENFIKNKVEALPSVYTGNNELYINCYGFEYTDPFENIILDKIEIKFAKNLDPLSEYRALGAPVISAEEVENDICKIVVAKVKTPSSPTDPEPPASDEIEIATSNYNTNISKDVNLSHFKFGENILLEKGWNYRFYFYDKNNNLFAAPVIANTIPSGGTTLTKKSVANRYLSKRYDYWGAHNNISNNIVLNGLGIKLINSVQEHINDDSIHYTIAGSDYIDISTDGSNTISVTNIAESISDNTSNSLVTEGSLIKYANDTKDENGEIIEQGLLTKWHIENEYFHMQKSVADSLKSFNLDNYGIGDICKGVIMKLPYLSKIKSISLVAVTASEYNQPLPEKAMTWSNYRLKIVDTLSGQVLATSESGKNANSSANTAAKGYPIGLFDFVDSNTVINQIYCDAQREYQILFVNEADETVNIHLAYANGNGNYATYENYTFGELSPKVILPDGNIKEHPLSFSVAGQPAVDCKGYACDFAVDTVKSEELTHLSKQIGELKNYIAYMNAYINQLSN